MGFVKFVMVLVSLIILIKLSIQWLKQDQRERNKFPIRFNWKGCLVGVVILVVAVILVSTIGTVPTGCRGIVLEWNAPTGKVLDRGFYIIVPVSQKVVLMSVQVKAYETEAASASRDLQVVKTKVTLNYAVGPQNVATLFTEVGVDYTDVIIKPAVQEAVKAATATFDAEKLITERHTVKEKIEDILSQRLNKHGIILDAVSITDFDFSSEFNTAIELKVTAAQNALKAENDLRRIQFEAQQILAKATADAKAIEIQVKAIQQQGGEAYVNLKAIERWNGQLPTIMMGSGAVPFLNLPASMLEGKAGK